MKKLIIVAMAGFIMTSVLIFTGYGSKKSNEFREIENCLGIGVNDGEIKWSRFSNYGSGNYDDANEWREYRKSKGDVVSDITLNNRTYWFTAGQIAG